MPSADEGELRAFMAAIRQVESGGEADPYLAQGFSEHPQWGRAQGAYQIMSGILPEFAAKAGYEGLTVEQFLADPALQDHIAGTEMRQLYSEYGDWRLVAAAWFGGRGAANEARDHGWAATSDRSDGGNSVPEYVEKVVAALESGVVADTEVRAPAPVVVADPPPPSEDELEEVLAAYEDAAQQDSDLDGLLDALETDIGTDPESVDTDGDDLSDSYELLTAGTDPTLADTDRDGIEDAVELALGLDPLDPDSDRDGVLDGTERSGAEVVDADGDRLEDALEELLGTDPTRIDSDGDGLADGLEYLSDHDPLDPMSPTPGSPDGPATGEDLAVAAAETAVDAELAETDVTD